jgi:hypothetical protein
VPARRRFGSRWFPFQDQVVTRDLARSHPPANDVDLPPVVSKLHPSLSERAVAVPVGSTPVLAWWQPNTPALIAQPTRVSGDQLLVRPDTYINSAVAYVSMNGLMYLIETSSLSAPAQWAMLSLTLSSAGLLLMRRALRRRQLRRAFEATPHRPLHAIKRGERTRLIGIARPRTKTLTTIAGDPALVVRYLGTRGKLGNAHQGRLIWEVHAVDFDLVKDDGTRVWIRTEHLMLLPHPPPIPNRLADGRPILADDPQIEQRDYAWIHRLESLSPGDVVEIVGRFDLLADPSVGVASDRQPPLGPALVGSPDDPIWLSPRTGPTLLLP